MNVNSKKGVQKTTVGSDCGGENRNLGEVGQTIPMLGLELSCPVTEALSINAIRRFFFLLLVFLSLGAIVVERCTSLGCCIK